MVSESDLTCPNKHCRAKFTTKGNRDRHLTGNCRNGKPRRGLFKCLYCEWRSNRKTSVHHHCKQIHKGK